jgi:hypothetical protein
MTPLPNTARYLPPGHRHVPRVLAATQLYPRILYDRVAAFGIASARQS